MKRKLVAFLVVSILTISFVFYGYQICYSPNILVDKPSRILILKDGITYEEFLLQMIHGGYVNDMVSFSFIAKLYGLHKISLAGRYALRTNMNNLAAVRAFKAKVQHPVSITFSNVRMIGEMAPIITHNIGMTPAEFDEALNLHIAKNTDGFNKDNILCLFLPNTYQVYYNVSPKKLVERMEQEYNKFWNQDRRRLAAEQQLTPIEVSILASIVQAEAVNEDEAPRIAGLYLNRLKKKILLQADPTIVFASGNFGLKRVLNEHKKIDSRYNTYRHVGLPPGPINLPRLKMIDAVLHAEKHNYIFMCAKPDFSGYHNFSKNYVEHMKNARAYQTALTIEQRKAAARQSR